VFTAATGALVSACGDDDSGGGSGSDSKTTTLWYWAGGLSDKVVADAVTQFTSKTTMKPSVIGGDFKAKLVTTLASGKFVPDITGVKGEDVAAFLPQANKFVDLNTLGATKLSSEYLTWKLKKATTQDGKLIGFPIDIGPDRRVLPRGPVQAGRAAVRPGCRRRRDLDLGRLLRARRQAQGEAAEDVPGEQRWVDLRPGDRAGHAAVRRRGEPLHRRPGPRAQGLGHRGEAPVAGHQREDQRQQLERRDRERRAGRRARRRVARARHLLGGAGHQGQVAGGDQPGRPVEHRRLVPRIPKEAANPQLAFEIITWLLSPENQARGFTDAALFPSAPAAYKLPALTGGDPFFGGQATIDVFGPAAEKIPVSYEAPSDAAVSAPYFNELTNIETKGKSPEDAWNDAVSQAKQIAKRQGVD
jgi:cellobiose transport system substrate-binding protein